MSTLSPACLGDDFEIYNIDTDYDIEVERGPHFLIEFPIESKLPAAKFRHDNIARTVDRTLHYKHDHPKRWEQKSGTCHFFVVPREHIWLLPEKGWSWPRATINGAPVHFNCCGGPGPKGWRHRLDLETSVNVNYGIEVLNTVAAVSVRGTAFEPVKIREEIEAEFYARHSNDWLVNAAWGDWQGGVPEGMVGVVATIGGSGGRISEERYFLVPAEEYALRECQFVVDPDRHQETKDFTQLPYKR